MTQIGSKYNKTPLKPIKTAKNIYLKTQTQQNNKVNFKTTETTLSKIFRAISTTCRVRIATRPNPANATLPPLSQGYGFVTFESAEKAAQALLTFQSHCVDGHKLLLQFAKPSISTAPGGQMNGGKMEQISAHKEKSRNKIVVKNLPFEATAKEVRELFAEFGEVKACRVPARLKGHRGFAFVEFFSEAEAAAALRKLKDTHLYGRHLVLQWAESGRVGGEK